MDAMKKTNVMEKMSAENENQGIALGENKLRCVHHVQKYYNWVRFLNLNGISLNQAADGLTTNVFGRGGYVLLLIPNNDETAAH